MKHRVARNSASGHQALRSALLDLFGQPHFDQRLVGDIALVGGDLDPFQQGHRQPQRDRRLGGLQIYPAIGRLSFVMLLSRVTSVKLPLPVFL